MSAPLSPQLPHIALHVIPRHHPQGIVMDEDAGSMTGFPGRLRHLVPVDAVRRMPNVVAVLLVIPLHHPHAVVEGGHLVILPRLPRGVLYVPLPAHAVCRAPYLVEVLPLRLLGRVVGAAAKE